MKENEIRVGCTYAGTGWTTPRKVEEIVTEPGRWGATNVLYSRVGGKKGLTRKALCHFAFEATHEVT